MDTAPNSAARYSRGAIALHWIIALLIVLNFVVAWLSEDMPKEDAAIMMGNHKAIGITILALTAVRIIWKLTHKTPPLVETLKAWEAALAKVTHGLMYLLMLAIPLAGWGLSSAWGKGKPVSMFGLFDVPALPVGSDKPTVGMFHELHEITATLMLVLFALHVGAALKHHLVDKDSTLRRMVPWMK
ncbi:MULTISPECIES: cytochrome b [unclassified Novosphingobium]|uniref:cytochrome b n=1 Tax=unclassified Novosphingobium TaxID=2644732 RepID=UPI002600A004|nr:MULTISPECIES: cytochrome b [unclassified Novosphingobium]HQV03965.1 cytochrome b [Novosphingobium sp.]